MTVKVANAITAYLNAGRSAPGLEPRDAAPGGSFAEMLKDVAQSAVQAGRRSEELSMQAAAGKADLTEVVTAVTNAEVTLQTVIAVRDRVVQAYQDILRMPI